MLRCLVIAAASCIMALATLPASASILIQIDKTTQRMTVSQDGRQVYTWPVSTGLSQYDTPGGSFSPFRMEKEHFSREWDDAPMPHSIFFTTRGHAIHGTEHTRNIGRAASHGCVRLEPENARILFGMVKQEGMANTKVVLTGSVPASSAPAMVRRAPRPDDDMTTGSVYMRRDAQAYPPRDDRPIYWGPRQARPSDFYDDTPYPRRWGSPQPRYFGPRSNWD
jgi:hypothetical protein